MKLTTKRDELVSKLSIVSRAVSTRAPMTRIAIAGLMNPAALMLELAAGRELQAGS